MLVHIRGDKEGKLNPSYSFPCIIRDAITGRHLSELKSSLQYLSLSLSSLIYGFLSARYWRKSETSGARYRCNFILARGDREDRASWVSNGSRTEAGQAGDGRSGGRGGGAVLRDHSAAERRAGCCKSDPTEARPGGGRGRREEEDDEMGEEEQ